MNTLSIEKKVKVISALVEGNSIRSVERMTGIHRDTIMRLGVTVGLGCADLLDTKLRDLPCKRIQVDEIWTFVYVKERRMNGVHNHAEMGDQYVFVAIDADTKLVVTHRVSKRDAHNTYDFIADLKERLATRVQLTTDGFKPYLQAVEEVFGADVDFAQLVKLYGQDRKASSERDWYSPVRVMAAIPMRITGKPDPWKISTSFIERQNLTMRMQIRRLTRLTNAFSKKLENLKAAVALHFAHYNFCRIHKTLRATPAMAAGVSSSIWTVDRLLSIGSN